MFSATRPHGHCRPGGIWLLICDVYFELKGNLSSNRNDPMRSQEGEYSRRALIARVHENIELSWRKRYEQFLDLNGREPRPIDERSVALILVFFVLSWVLATWQGMVHL